MDNSTIHIDTIFPIYISMTTIPPRMKNTSRIIQNIINRVTGFEKIILNIPKKYKNFNEIFDYPVIKNNKVIINIIEKDMGPISKLIPTLNIIPRESILLICDDDCYNHEAFKIIAEKQDKIHSKSFTFWKYSYNGIEVPQGADIISFWTPNLEGIQYNETCFYVDDLVIGMFLKTKGIEIEQLNRNWKWPYIPNCLSVKNNVNLFSKKGENSRDLSMKKCFNIA